MGNCYENVSLYFYGETGSDRKRLMNRDNDECRLKETLWQTYQQNAKQNK